LNQSHQELLKQLDLIRGEIEAMGQEWTSPEFKYFTDFLQDWLINHVIREDLLMKHVLQKHPPDFNPDRLRLCSKNKKLQRGLEFSNLVQ
jgi:hemerythrin